MTDQKKTQPLSTKHAEWLENERGLSVELCAKFGLMSTPTEIGFPFIENGQCRFVKWRKLDKSSMRISPAGESLIPFNLDELFDVNPEGLTLVITEGEFDTIAVSQAGHLAISVPAGAVASVGRGDIDPFDDRKFQFLWRDGKIRPEIAKFSRIVLMGDNDEPGRALIDELATRIGRHKAYCVRYPNGCKDANDILRMHGEAVLGKLIRDAKPLVPDRIVRLEEIPVTDRANGLASGWKNMDRHLRLTFPEMVTVTGVPGAGKSQWTLAWVLNLARLHGLKATILQFEDDVERNRADIYRYAEAFHQEIGDPAQWVNEHIRVRAPAVRPDDEAEISLEWVRGMIEEAAVRHGCKVIVLDPWNEIEHAFTKNLSETQYTNEALREIKRLSRLYQIAIIIVTHPTKGITGKGIDELTMYEVAGSAAWANKSDHGIIICREEGASETHVKVAKCKHYERMGVPGIVTMEFVPDEGRFRLLRSGI